jgi:hypothetical protein
VQPDLFTQIREALHEKQMTLMVLVEDMSLITAIEDVLIDSLEREGIRDGKEVLCPVCSAIAVTDGYQGYARRRQGMLDRAKGEWVIEEVGAVAKRPGSVSSIFAVVISTPPVLAARPYCSVGKVPRINRTGRQTGKQPLMAMKWLKFLAAVARGSRCSSMLARFTRWRKACRDDRNELKFNPVRSLTSCCCGCCSIAVVTPKRGTFRRHVWPILPPGGAA